MRRIICVAFAVLLVVCGCGNDVSHINSDKPSDNTVTGKVSEDIKEPMNPNSEPKAEKEQPKMLLSNAKKIANVGEKVSITSLGPEYEITIDKAYVTKMFEEDTSLWTDFIIDDCEIKDNELIDGTQILYIEYQINNVSNEPLDYGANTVWALFEDEGELFQASIDLGYNSNATKGKGANIMKIKPQETKSFRIGYILVADSIGKPLYLELTCNTSDSDMIVVPVQEDDQL